MEIKKAAAVEQCGVPDLAQLEQINALAKGKLTADQVYVFSVRLCDDQPDRDEERFDKAALPALAKLFVGKTGITDHRWSSDGQVARIFSTEVLEEDGVTYIKAWAYIRRGGKAEEVIADIEAGIKKEVSVGCAMGQSVCSVCGGEYGVCGHVKGEIYEGERCCCILRQPLDAYEFSFVAVPAQRGAGVIKGMGRTDLKALAEEFGAQEEYALLLKQAKLGGIYESELKDKVVRLCLSLDLGMAEPTLRSIVKYLPAQELMAMEQALEEKCRARFPMKTQLPGGATAGRELDGGYLI